MFLRYQLASGGVLSSVKGGCHRPEGHGDFCPTLREPPPDYLTAYKIFGISPQDPRLHGDLLKPWQVQGIDAIICPGQFSYVDATTFGVEAAAYITHHDGGSGVLICSGISDSRG